MSKKIYTVDQYDDFKEVSGEKIILLEDFVHKEIANLMPVIQEFITAYAKDKLDEILKKNLSDRSVEEILKLPGEIQSNVSKWNTFISEVNLSCAEGYTAEEWFVRKLSKSVDFNEKDYEIYISTLLDALHKENYDSLKLLGFSKDFGTEKFVSLLVTDLVRQFGREVQISGLTGITIEANSYLSETFLSSGKIEPIQAVANALSGGDDTGVKVAVTSALMVAVERGNLPIFSKDTPTEVIAGTACFGIEQAKIMLQFATGEISSTQALSLIGRASVVNASLVISKLGEKVGRQVGQKVGMAIGTIIPAVAPIGVVVGGYIGAIVGSLAGSSVGKAISKAAEKLSVSAKVLIGKTCSVMKSVWKGLKNEFKFFASIFS